MKFKPEAIRDVGEGGRKGDEVVQRYNSLTAATCPWVI